MKVWVKVIVLFLLSLGSRQSFSQGKIEKSKEEIKKGNKRESHQQSQPVQSSNNTDCTEERSFGNIIFEGVVTGLAYITWYSVIGSYKLEDHLHSNLTKYPYYNHYSGNYESTDSVSNSKIHFRFDVDNEFLYSNKDLIGNHLTCNIRPFQYFYLQGQYYQLTEYNANHTHSDLSLFNLYLCYDRLRFERFNAGLKVGMCYIGNNVNAGGFSFGLNAEAFLIKPVSLYVSKQWGGINHVAVNQFEIGGKFHLKRYNINLGYEHFKIGSPLYDYIALGAGIHL
jgi:hypothetical protein